LLDYIPGEFSPIKTVVPGMDVCELLPRHAQVVEVPFVGRTTAQCHVALRQSSLSFE
jgi:hypothetical protein